MTDDIERMTDEELVRACAVEIVPHSQNTGIYNFESTPNVWRRNGLEWRPLESWDDCMMVVNAMRAKGWGVSISAYPTEKYDFVNFYNPST